MDEFLKENSIIVFENKKIRRIWHQNQRYFSVVDVIEALVFVLVL